MTKLAFQNLAMIVTNQCNLNCDHCMRGTKNSEKMSEDVIKATFKDTIAISNLGICGGEPTLATDVIEYIFNYIIDNKIYLEDVSCVINGTIYSEEFLRLFDYINEYVKFISKKSKVFFNISYDRYHLKEVKERDLKEQYIDSIKKYQLSPYFRKLQELDFGKLFREGNSEKLSEDVTVNLEPMQIYLAYDKNIIGDLCNIGPLVTINTEGIITECDASIINQHTKYNYGNVLSDSIEDVMLRQGKVVSSRKWNRLTVKEIKRYQKYQ